MLESQFDKYVDEWTLHCKKPEVRVSSSVIPLRDCDAYRKIVSMGPNVLPFVRRLYDKDNSNNFELSIIQAHGLIGIVKEIIGDDFQIPEDIRGRVSEVESYTKDWLDHNMPQYVSN